MIAILTNRPLAVAITTLALIAALALPGAGTGIALAQTADRDKPTQVEADRLEYEDARQRTVFTGKVVLTKGTLIIKGDRLVLEQGANDRQTAVATGKPASFRQKRDGVDQLLEGIAAKIEYDSGPEKLVFTGGAILTRTECGRQTDQISGALIVYDARAETFTVDGKPKSDGSGRVRVTIQPRAEGRDASSAAGKAPAPCPSAAPLNLKTAPRIESPRAGSTTPKP